MEEVANCEVETKKKGLTIPYLRLCILILTLAATALPNACHFAFTFSVACDNPPGLNRSFVYHRDPSHSPIVYFPRFLESLAFGAFPLGQLLALPFLQLISFISVKHQVLIAIASSGILCLLFPVLFDFCPVLAVVSKIIHGMLAAPTIPLLGHVCSHWAPLAEVGLFVGTVTCFPQIGLFFTQATSGPMCTLGGWRLIFYCHGAVTLVIGVLWLALFTDFPHEHSRLRDKELQHISVGKELDKKAAEDRAINIPYSELFACKSLWGSLAAALGTYGGIAPIINFTPLIMRKGLDISEMHITYFSSTSVALQSVLKVLSGVISDKLTFAEVRKLQLFNSLACAVPGVLLVITPFILKEYTVACVVMLIVSQSLVGFNSAGFNRACIVMGGKYSPFVLTVVGIILNISFVSAPFLFGVVAPDHTWAQWKPLFISLGIFLFASNLIFCWLTDGKPFVKNK